MRARKLVTVVVIAAALALAARYLFWNPKRDVRLRLEAIAGAASAPRNETPLARAARAAELGRWVTDDVILRTDAAAFVGGRPAVLRLAMESAPPSGERTVTCDDVQIELIDASTSTVFCTLKIASGDPQTPVPVPRQIHATFLKMGGQWLLSRAEVLRMLN
jgi:hypothetical protein